MTAENNKNTEAETTRKMEWEKLSGYLALICGVDIQLHYQLMSDAVLNTGDSLHTTNESLTSQSNSTITTVYTSQSHSKTATILYYSSIIRMLLVLTCFIVCKKKCLPKIIQPYMHYVMMTTVFILCSLTMWRLLLDSEPPNTVAYFGYIFLLSVDITFLFTEYGFCRYVMKNSGAITEPDESEKDHDQKKSKEKRMKTRKREQFQF